MRGRVMKKDEFVQRMLADQELRRERRNAEFYGYIKSKQARHAHKTHLKRKQGGNWS